MPPIGVSLEERIMYFGEGEIGLDAREDILQTGDIVLVLPTGRIEEIDFHVTGYDFRANQLISLARHSWIGRALCKWVRK